MTQQNSPVSPKIFRASIFQSGPIPEAFATAVISLEKSLSMPLWVLIQGRNSKMESIDQNLWGAILNSPLGDFPKCGVALLLDSPGGNAKCAFQIAKFFKQQCEQFSVIIPRYAKSAATLLSLGATNLYLGKMAELGPLDVQVFDPDREGHSSALDEVQALERLQAFSLEAFDRTMLLLVGKTGKKVETLLPMTLKYVTDLMRPLLEKIDAVHYTQMSRALKVAEEYAIRLLQPKYTKAQAEKIARHLVEKYPEHGFVIDAGEASSFGLETSPLSVEQEEFVSKIIPFLGKLCIVGRLLEVPNA